MRGAGILGFMVVAVSVSAQTPNRDNAPGFWAPWTWEADSSEVTASGATPAEMKTLVAKLLELREILKATPAVAAPVGFNAYLQGHFNGAAGRTAEARKQSPLAARLWFGAFPQEFDKAGNLTRELGETELLPIEVNVIPSGSTPPDWSRVDTDVVLQPKALPEVAGLPRFDDVLILKRNRRELWSPVSMETALGLLAAQRKKILADHDKAAADMRKAVADWVDPARKALRMKTYEAAAAKQSNPDAYLAAREADERKIEATLRTQLEQSGNPTNNKFWAADLAQAAAIDQALAGLTPEQKSAPACYLEQTGRVVQDRPLARIVPTDTGGCRPLVRRNAAFFDRALPRAGFQVLTVGMISRCLDAPARRTGAAQHWGCPVNVAFIQSVDWEKVAALLDR